ncbi:MAG: outer membrane beta-barrel protein [Muribaculaceae bacterium]|nr:outer membrane beta-barrel protein [Muribaculaceae bacterium]
MGKIISPIPNYIMIRSNIRKWNINSFGLVLGVALLSGSATVKAEEAADSVESKELSELVVTANPKIITKEGSITKIKIHGTPFSQMGSVADMLGNVPGLMNIGNGIQVAGLGTPIYYLDGRELTDISQLNVLQSSDIKDIRIERAPGPEYPAGTKAVVLLTTYNPLKNNIYLAVNNTFGIGRKVSDFPGINFKAKAGRFVTSLAYNFGTSGSEVRETYFRKIEHPTYEFERSQERRLPMRRISNTVNWSGEYQLNTFNRIGLHYYFTNAHRKEKECGINVITDESGVSSIDVLDNKNVHTNLHSVSAVYDYASTTKAFHLSQDFAFNGSNSKSNVTETPENQLAGNIEETWNSNNTTYRVATTNFRSNFYLPWQIYAQAGVRFTYVNSSSRLETTDDNLTVWLNNSKLNVDEYTPQAYVALGRMIGKVLISPGVRYEYTYRRIADYDLLGTGDNRYHYDKSSFYPFLTAQYYGGKINAFLQYSRSVVHPDFNLLNSGLAYVDNLTYSLGNPNLEAMTVNYLRGGLDFGDFSLELQYLNRQNPLEDVDIPIAASENVVYSTWINLPRYERFTTGLSYGATYGGLNCYGRVDFNFHRSKLPTEFVNNFSIDVNANVSYQFNSRFSAYVNYALQGRNKVLLTTQRSVQNLNLGLSGKFFNDRLDVNFEVTDILGKANYNNLSSTYMNVTSGTRNGSNDMRGVRLRLSYTLFNKPIRVTGSRENTEILNRVK